MIGVVHTYQWLTTLYQCLVTLQQHSTLTARALLSCLHPAGLINTRSRGRHVINTPATAISRGTAPPPHQLDMTQTHLHLPSFSPFPDIFVALSLSYSLADTVFRSPWWYSVFKSTNHTYRHTGDSTHLSVPSWFGIDWTAVAICWGPRTTFQLNKMDQNASLCY